MAMFEFLRKEGGQGAKLISLGVLDLKQEQTAFNVASSMALDSGASFAGDGISVYFMEVRK